MAKVNDKSAKSNEKRETKPIEQARPEPVPSDLVEAASPTAAPLAARTPTRDQMIAAAKAAGFDALAGSSDTSTIEASGSLIEDKDLLCDVPFLILHTHYRQGDYIDKETGYPSEYVTVTAMLRTGEVVIFNDGSTGVCDQLRGATTFPILCRNGLRRSDYIHPKHGKASTYYLTGDTPTSEIQGLNRTPRPFSPKQARPSQAATNSVEPS